MNLNSDGGPATVLSYEKTSHFTSEAKIHNGLQLTMLGFSRFHSERGENKYIINISHKPGNDPTYLELKSAMQKVLTKEFIDKL